MENKWIVPFADFVIVETIEADSMSAGGIILDGASIEQEAKVRVIAVGPGRYSDYKSTLVDMPKEIKPGAVLSYHGNDLKHKKVLHNGKTYYAMRSSEFYGVLPEEK